MQIADSIATLRNTTDFLSTIKKQAIVKPDNLNGIAGFVFDIIDNDSITLESDISKNYVEDNSSRGDHIALKPEQVSVTGFTGELKERTERAIPLLNELESKLTTIEAYLPSLPVPLAQSYQSVKKSIETFDRGYKGVEDLYNLFFSNDPRDKETNQSRAFSFFYSMWENREIFTVDTPHKLFTNMAISKLDVSQGDSVSVSEFIIVFEKIRFTKEVTVIKDQNRRANQKAQKQNKGSSRGKEVNQSALFKGKTFLLGA